MSPMDALTLRAVAWWAVIVPPLLLAGTIAVCVVRKRRQDRVWSAEAAGRVREILHFEAWELELADSSDNEGKS